ncbi:MAG: IS66 family transposase [Paludibacter sp.]
MLQEIELLRVIILANESVILQKERSILEKECVISQKDNIITQKDGVICDLTFQLQQIRRAIFGSKSERFVPVNPDQLRLAFDMGEEMPVVPEKEQITYKRHKRAKMPAKPNVRLAIPAHLPRVTEIIEPENIPEGSKKMGEEVTEVMELTPASIYVRRIVRPKYALPQEAGVMIANLPSLPLPRSNAGSSLLAYLIVNKYVNHLPFYRQVQMFKRDGIVLAESTINSWFANTADLLEPLYNEIWNQIKGLNHLFVDESTIPVLNVDKPGGTVKGYHWIFKGIDPKVVFFYYNQGSRGYHILHEVLPGFQGAVQCDGYGAYDDLEKVKGIITIGCWAHARRKFEQALGNDPQLAQYALLKIQELYDIERLATDANYTYLQIKELRETESYPKLREFETWLLDQIPTILPKSPIGKAILYTYGMYPKLVRYVMDGRYRIDNNLAENAVRPLALGRKNYLFCGNHQSAHRTAIIYSLMGSCKANDVNPQEWLTDVLGRILDHNIQKLDELLPHNWKLNRP